MWLLRSSEDDELQPVEKEDRESLSYHREIFAGHGKASLPKNFHLGGILSESSKPESNIRKIHGELLSCCVTRFGNTIGCGCNRTHLPKLDTTTLPRHGRQRKSYSRLYKMTPMLPPLQFLPQLSSEFHRDQPKLL